MEGERELVTANDLRRDGDQIFLSFPTIEAPLNCVNQQRTKETKSHLHSRFC